MLSWLGRTLHVSWLIGWLALGIVIGVALAAWSGAARALPWPWLAVAGALSCASWLRPRAWAVVPVMTAGLIIGCWRGGLEQSALLGYHTFIGKNVTVQATVADDAAFGPGGDQRLSLKDVVVNNVTLNGHIWVSTDLGPAVQRSDHVTLRGKLGPGFGSLAASMFHATLTRISRPEPGDIGLHVRDWFADGIRTAIPEPEASLASGYLVGQRNTLPTDLDAQLKTVGLTHAVVASGYNLTILVSLTRQLLASVSKYLATASATATIVGFVMISGLSPSMTRAGLVSGLSLATWYYGRQPHPLVLLPLAAAVTALVNPFYVWGDIGWYLSFTSFAGVIILAPLIQHALWHGRERPGIIMQVIIDTLSAQIATMPIMILAFGHYSPYALLANLLVLPLVPLTMLLTFVAGLSGLAIPSLAHFIGLSADLILRYMIWLVGHIADLPGAEGNLAIDGTAVTASYIVLIAATAWLWRKTGYDFRRPSKPSEA